MSQTGGIGGGFSPKGVQKNFQHKHVAQKGVQQTGSEHKEPSDLAEIGFVPLTKEGGDTSQVLGEKTSEQPITAQKDTKATTSTGAPSILTSMDFDIGGSTKVDAGITALNGVGSVTLTSATGEIRASANPLQPVTLSRMPTTSTATNGLEDTQFVTTSGRVVDGKPTVKMPTTSISLLNGLESTQFETTSGRLITV